MDERGESMKLIKNMTIAMALTALASAAALAAPKYKADVPESILTPDQVETRLGTLRFNDGAPDADTVKLAYDNLDFMRGM
jgi:cobalamin biosynthesis protein CbiD